MNLITSYKITKKSITMALSVQKPEDYYAF